MKLLKKMFEHKKDETDEQPRILYNEELSGLCRWRWSCPCAL